MGKDVESGPQEEPDAPPAMSFLKKALASLLWLFWAVFWSCVSVDWQRTRHLFEVYMLDDTYKIVDSSIVKEQDLLQTSAVFLFGAGLVTNFLSGAPFDNSWTGLHLAVINGPLYANKTLAERETLNTQVLGTAMQLSAPLRGLWGTCMLLTLMAVICAYVSRTALFLCWSLIRMKLEDIRARAKWQAEDNSLADNAASIKAAADAATAREYQRETSEDGKGTNPFKKLARLVSFIAGAVSVSKLLFVISLLLWLANIMLATVAIYTLRTSLHRKDYRTVGGFMLLSIAGIVTLLATYAFTRLLTDCWTAFALWKPDVKYTNFMRACAARGIWQACIAEPRTQVTKNSHLHGLALRGSGQRVLSGSLSAGRPFAVAVDICSRPQPDVSNRDQHGSAFAVGGSGIGSNGKKV